MALLPHINGVLREHDGSECQTVFGENCPVLVDAARACKNCSRLHRVDNNHRKRKAEQQMVHPFCNKRFMTKQDIECQLKSEQRANRNAERRELYLRQKFENEAALVADEDQEDLLKISARGKSTRRHAENVEMVVKGGKHRLVGFVELGCLHDDMLALEGLPKVDIKSHDKYMETTRERNVEVYLGNHLYNGNALPRKQMVEMYQAGTPTSVKEHNSRSMALHGGNVCVLICTVAFGLDANSKKVAKEDILKSLEKRLNAQTDRAIAAATITVVQERAGFDGCHLQDPAIPLFFICVHTNVVAEFMCQTEDQALPILREWNGPGLGIQAISWSITLELK
ncbi:hypothetical protein ACROYT_G014774 [Oculina patagonica]